MKTTKFQKLLSLILCVALIAAVALMTIGCDGNDQQETSATSADTSVSTQAATEAATEAVTEAETASDVTVKGNGATVFYFNVVDGEGNTTRFEIHTDKATVGEALLEVELIAGEEGAYGLYVKTVNGITADYDVDQTWWEFLVGEQSSMTGVDMTEVEAGETYTFRISK